MKRIQIDSEEQLKEVAEALLESLDGRTVVALRGEMGAGKTTLIRSVAEALGAEDQVTSPTFALVNEYVGGRLSLYHFDMYRIDDEDSLYSIGYYDYLEGGGICFAEWCEKIEPYLPETYYTVTIRKCADDTNQRIITITEEKR